MSPPHLSSSSSNLSSTRSNMGRTDSATMLDPTSYDYDRVKSESGSSLEEKRARKREQDRLCQRRKREKDRENLRRLEARLDGLQNANESKTVLDLLLRHEQDQAKIDRQVERLRQLQTLLNSSLDDLTNDATTPTDHNDSESQMREASESVGEGQGIGSSICTSNPPSVTTTTLGPIHGSSPIVHHSTAIISGTMGTSASMYNTAMPVLGSYPTSTTFASVTAGVMAASMAYATTAPPKPSQPVAPWVQAGNMVEDACARASNPGAVDVVDTAESIDQHILIMVIIHGWEHAAASIQLNHALWSCLRQVDQAIVGAWTKVERAMGLYSIWRLMKASAQGPLVVSQMMPKFFRPRPSQLHISHRPDIDYFPWPGVRERLLFDQERYYGQENFLRLFSQNTCFIWPFGFSDLYFENKETGLCQFSAEAMRRFHNINYWSVNASFLAEYPEFIGDIPTYNSVSPPVEEKVNTNQHYYFQDGDEGPQTTLPSEQQANWVFNGNGFVDRNAST